jgi:hypothetical protein
MGRLRLISFTPFLQAKRMPRWRIRNKNQEPRAKSQEPRAKSQEPRAKSQEPRAKSQEPRTKNQEPRQSIITKKL